VDQNGNIKRNRGRARIEKWETVAVLHEEKVEGEQPIGLKVEVQCPVFEDGRKGRPRMGCVVRRGDRSLRFQCYEGSMSEIDICAELFAHATAPELAEKITAGYSEIMAQNASEVDKRQRRDASSNKRLGQPGGGLGRFSKPGKTARKRSRSREGRQRGNV
jgi:hypothetical protein